MTKISALSLVKYSGLSFAEIDLAVPANSGHSSQINHIADSIVAGLPGKHFPTPGDVSIIYYISGAIARSILPVTKCNDCKEALLDAGGELKRLQYESVHVRNADTFPKDIDRGGLLKPCEYIFTLMMQCWSVCEDIKASPELKKQLICADNKRTLFVQIMDRVQDSNCQIKLIDNQYFCSAGHDLKDLTVKRFFNCVAKNLVKDMTSEAATDSKPCSKKRKVAKLTNQPHNSFAKTSLYNVHRQVFYITEKNCFITD